jgi:hypothetical protein
VRSELLAGTQVFMASKSQNNPPKLTDPELDLLAHMKHGYRLETESLGEKPVLRRLQDDEVIRPLSVNRNTIHAMEDRGRIKLTKGQDPLAIVWRLRKKVM